MIASQYKITLPGNYDMDIIKNRVKENGHKTDGFPSLRYEFYLISEKGINQAMQNSYCPLYLWNDSEGLNTVLFEGFYDNILGSFGWQKVNIGILLVDQTAHKMKDAKYVLELEGDIKPGVSLNNLKQTIMNEVLNLGVEYVITYNPENWKYHVYYFMDDVCNLDMSQGNIFTILHISQS